MKPAQFLLEPRKAAIERVVLGRTRSLVVVLDQLEDPFNMAAVLRTSEALGLQEVHVVKNATRGFSPSTKVTQGCEKWLDIVSHRSMVDCAAHLRQRGFRILVTAANEGAMSLYATRWDEPTAVVFGNERTGVSQETIAQSTGSLWIPLSGFAASLNVSAATAACLSWAVGWRQAHLGANGDLTPADTRIVREQFEALSVKQRGRIDFARKAIPCTQSTPSP